MLGSINNFLLYIHVSNFPMKYWKTESLDTNRLLDENPNASAKSHTCICLLECSPLFIATHIYVTNLCFIKMFTDDPACDKHPAPIHDYLTIKKTEILVSNYEQPNAAAKSQMT